MRGRWIEDQNAPRRSIVQVRPSELDLLQLPQNTLAEVADGKFIAGLVRVHSELAVDLPPCDPLRGAAREGAVDQPQVEIEAQRRAFEGLEGGEIEWDRMAHNLIEE